MNDVKKRYWGAVVYPESLPENWKELLTETGLPVAVSPLHDKDINPSTNEAKKPHYHLILAWSGPVRESVVQKVTDKLNGAHKLLGLESVKGAYRYLTHKDNPEKYQYDEKEIVCLNGFNIQDYADLTQSELAKVRMDTLNLIKEQDIIEYADLIDYCCENDLSDVLEYAATHTYFVDRYISSSRNKRQNALKQAENELKRVASEYQQLVKKVYDSDIVTSESEKRMLDLFGEFERIEGDIQRVSERPFEDDDRIDQ